MNVLVADDDPVMIRLLSTELRKAGFATFIAYDVVQATVEIRRSRIDVVVTDLCMPGGSGRDIIHRLKSSTRTGQIPVIVVSGSIGPEARQEFIDMGADGLFLKPPDIPALIRSIRELAGIPSPAADAAGVEGKGSLGT